jgi:AMP deaminase
LKYNPIGESRLREIFLKTDNMIKGRFLAEMIREVIEQLEASKYQCSELRVSVYGRSKSEWDALAAWVMDHNLISDNVRYLVQIPRLYSIYKANKLVDNFQNMVDSASASPLPLLLSSQLSSHDILFTYADIFRPLFEVTMDPSSHPKLHEFLKYCVGIDCVDDESKPEARILHKYPAPSKWVYDKNPPYTYYLYYLYANLYTLNRFREAKGYSTLHLRPHSGEAGDVDHLASAFMLGQGIAHGIMLRKSPVLQYLFVGGAFRLPNA